eukprot:1090387-Prymnesium_polylepis.1
MAGETYHLVEHQHEQRNCALGGGSPEEDAGEDLQEVIAQKGEFDEELIFVVDETLKLETARNPASTRELGIMHLGLVLEEHPVHLEARRVEVAQDPAAVVLERERVAQSEEPQVLLPFQARVGAQPEPRVVFGACVQIPQLDHDAADVVVPRQMIGTEGGVVVLDRHIEARVRRRDWELKGARHGAAPLGVD